MAKSRAMIQQTQVLVWGWRITDSKINAWQVKVMDFSVSHTWGGKMYPETYPGL